MWFLAFVMGLVFLGFSLTAGLWGHDLGLSVNGQYLMAALLGALGGLTMSLAISASRR